MIANARVILLTLALTVAAGGAVSADVPKKLGEFRDWAAFTLAEGDGVACYIASRPLDSEPKGVKRGEIWMLVTHRPYKNVQDEVSFYSGYPYKENSTVNVDIDGIDYEMFTHEETAWSLEPKDDAKLVNAMRRGNRMVIRGLSTRGTETTDHFSLLGFTAAHEAIGKACNVQ